MTPEKNVKNQLIEKFSFLANAIEIKRPRRIFADIPADKFIEVFDFAIKKLSFDALTTITGLDEGNGYAIYYHLNRHGQIVLSLIVHIGKENPVIKTVSNYFPCADIYEREILDLLGIQVDGLAPGRRYPLPESFPKEHPLRKDWKKPAMEQE